MGRGVGGIELRVFTHIKPTHLKREANIVQMISFAKLCAQTFVKVLADKPYEIVSAKITSAGKG